VTSTPIKSFAPAEPRAKRDLRSRPLPAPRAKPKTSLDDRTAAARVRALLDSPSYLQADGDAEFLNLAATRGVRLQIDYLKAELLLSAYGVEHTIVVFGGTRIAEPKAARRRAAALVRRLIAEPNDARLRREVATAKRIVAKSRYYDMAREFGRIIGRCGAGPHDCRIMLMTGGGPGIMEAANRGAHDVGAKSIGLNIALPEEQAPNSYVTPELCLRFHYFSTRKLHFLLRARALVAFPGGYGTLDEVFETLNLVQSQTIDPVPVVLVGERYWRRAFDAGFLADEGVIGAEDRALFTYAESAAEIWQSILRWHAANGTPLQ
jgi:uncharacterized protein (TIGR00730 family)